MLVAGYSQVLRQQNDDMRDSHRSIIHFKWKTFALFFDLFISKRTMSKINASLVSQAYISKGFYATLIENSNKLTGTNFTVEIKLVQNLIKEVSTIRPEIEKLITESRLDGFKEGLVASEDLLSNLYNILRALKRLNIRENIPTSQIAIDSVQHSLNSLQRVMNEH